MRATEMEISTARWARVAWEGLYFSGKNGGHVTETTPLCGSSVKCG